MEDDLSALKKGQTPVGFGMQKESYTPPPPPSTPNIPPKPQVPQSFSQNFPQAGQMELGKTEKSKPLTPTPPTIAPTPVVPGKNIQSFTDKPFSGSIPPLPKPKPTGALEPALDMVSGPKKGGLNPAVLVIVVVILAIIGFSVWFFVFHKPSATVSNQPTPNGTITVSATPIPVIESVFTVVDSVTLETSSNSFTSFKTIISPQIKDIGAAGLYRVFKPQKANGDEYLFSEFMSGSGVSVPQNVLAVVNDSDFYITAIRETDGNIGYGFIVGINGDPQNAQTALTAWEATLPASLRSLFGFDSTKAASATFLDNVYQGVHVRYRNFPTPVLTIDYAVVTTADNLGYLVFTNSREHIYSIIDKVRTISAPITETTSPSK
jgi:hypothetical protein